MRRHVHREIQTALLDEMARFHAALQQGAHVIFHAKVGDETVLAIEAGGWLTCQTAHGTTLKHKLDPDAIWGDLVGQAGIARHHSFREQRA